MRVSILVVDDQPDVAPLFHQCFRHEVRDGTYVMHFDSSGEDALQKPAKGIEPRLIVVLSDINLPGIDGLILLGKIEQRFPDPPVMMVTAYDDGQGKGGPATSAPATSSPSRWILRTSGHGYIIKRPENTNQPDRTSGRLAFRSA